MAILPAELIILIFSKFMDIKDIIKFSYSSEYVFDIYKEHINMIIINLLNNNKHSAALYYAIKGVFHKDDTNEIKVKKMIPLTNFLSNNTKETLLQIFHELKNDNPYNINVGQRLVNYYFLRINNNFNHQYAKTASQYDADKICIFIKSINLGYQIRICNYIAQHLNNEQFNIMKKLVDYGIDINDAMINITSINKDNLEKLFELCKTFSFNMAIFIINNFSEAHMKTTEEFIEKGFSSTISADMAYNLNEETTELFMKINSMIINEEFLREVCYYSANAMKNIIKLLENNFSSSVLIEEIIEYVNEHDDDDEHNNAHINNDNDDERIDKFIMFKKIGIPENLMMLFYISNDYDYDRFKYLFENINDTYIIKSIIINNTNDEDIKTIINMIKDDIPPFIAFNICIIKLYTLEQYNLVKPYYNKNNNIEFFIKNYEIIQTHINLLQEQHVDFDNILRIICNSWYYSSSIKSSFISEIINTIQKLRDIKLDDNYIVEFIISNSSLYPLYISNNDNIFKSSLIDKHISLIRKGITNIKILNQIIYKTASRFFSICENLNDINISIINNFSEIQVDVFLHLVEEGQPIDNTIKIIQNCNNNNLTKIITLASSGQKYTTSIRTILSQYNSDGKLLKN
jgi:hypothetical protein